MKTFPIHLPNGSTVCTPDNMALGARVSRCKRILRHNIGLHKQSLKTSKIKADKRMTTRDKIVDGVLGTLLGLVCFASPFYLITLTF